MSTRPFRSEARGALVRISRPGEPVLASTWNRRIEAINRATDAVAGHDPERGLALRQGVTLGRLLWVYRSDGTVPGIQALQVRLDEVIARWNVATRGPEVPLDSADFGLWGPEEDEEGEPIPIEERVRSPYDVYPDPPETPGGWLTPKYEED